MLISSALTSIPLTTQSRRKQKSSRVYLQIRPSVQLEQQSWSEVRLCEYTHGGVGGWGGHGEFKKATSDCQLNHRGEVRRDTNIWRQGRQHSSWLWHSGDRYMVQPQAIAVRQLLIAVWGCIWIDTYIYSRRHSGSSEGSGRHRKSSVI